MNTRRNIAPLTAAVAALTAELEVARTIRATCGVQTAAAYMRSTGWSLHAATLILLSKPERRKQSRAASSE